MQYDSTNVDQVWSILPALGLLSLDCSSRRQMGSRKFIFVVGVILFVALDINGVCGQLSSMGQSPTKFAGITILSQEEVRHFSLFIFQSA